MLIDRTMLMPAKLRAARAFCGASQGELAKRAGVSRSTIVDMESGSREPHGATLAVVLAAFSRSGVDMTERGICFSGVVLGAPTAAPAP